MNTNGHKVSRCLDVPDIQRITSTLDVVADHRKRNPRHRRPFNIVDHLRQEGAETIWVTPRHQLPADRPMITPAIKHQQRTCRRRVHPSFRPTNIRRSVASRSQACVSIFDIWCGHPRMNRAQRDSWPSAAAGRRGRRWSASKPASSCFGSPGEARPAPPDRRPPRVGRGST
jgi:hypothetical protein